jgi:nucleoside-diphosphate-sugar epimerase
MLTLVTGATGFIGGHIVTALLERGDQVRGLVRDTERARGLRDQGVELVQGDVTDIGSLRRAVEGVECVFHTAALVGDWPDRKEARRVNVDATRDLGELSRAAGVRRFVQLSSLSVYGNRHHRGTDESAPYRYGDTYTDAKVDSDRAIRDLGAQGGIETICLRPGFVYGPGDRMLLPKLLAGLAEGRFMYVGDGSKQMNCVYVEDVARAAVLAATTPAAAGQAYNVTDGSQTTLRDFITFITDRVGLPAPTRHVPPPIAVVGCYTAERVGRLIGVRQAPMMNISRLRFLYYNQHYSIEKARRELGYEPRVAYREGLTATLEWFREEGLLPAGLALAGAYAS